MADEVTFRSAARTGRVSRRCGYAQRGDSPKPNGAAATARNEESPQKPLRGWYRPHGGALRGSGQCAEPLHERRSRCVPSTQVAYDLPGSLDGCNPTNRSGYGASRRRLTRQAARRRSTRPQDVVEGWRSIASGDEFRLRASTSRRQQNQLFRFQDVLIDRRSLFDCTEAPVRLKAALAALGAVGGLDPRQRLPHPVQLSSDGSLLGSSPI